MASRSAPTPPPGYFVAIGSNLDPERHVPVVVQALAEHFQRLWLSSIIRTEPVGMPSRNRFLNAVCFIPTRQSSEELKRLLITLEERLGRDRSDPDKKQKDRAADLDILFPASRGELASQTRMPEEPYIGPVYRQLAEHFGLVAPSPAPLGVETQLLEVSGVRIGERPVELRTNPPGSKILIQSITAD